MKPNQPDDIIIAPALEAEIRAVAADIHRPAGEIVREALEGYLVELHAHPRPSPDARTRSETVARILEQRKGNTLPEGTTIEDVIAWGREGRA